MSDIRDAVQGAISRPLTEARENSFIEILGHYSSLHIRLLTFLSDPNKGEKHSFMGSFGVTTVSKVIEGEFDSERVDALDVYSELQAHGFVERDNQISMGIEAAHQPRLTKMGRQLLDIINTSRS
jgi:hypothetical protein